MSSTLQPLPGSVVRRRARRRPREGWCTSPPGRPIGAYPWSPTS